MSGIGAGERYQGVGFRFMQYEIRMVSALNDRPIANARFDRQTTIPRSRSASEGLLGQTGTHTFASNRSVSTRKHCGDFINTFLTHLLLASICYFSPGPSFYSPFINFLRF
jgi:hypothetical protein